VRRPFLALGIAGIGIVAAVVFLWPVTRTGSEPIVYGRDTCARCRMHLSQPGFAGELRDPAGTLHKYDDLGCLLEAMRASGVEPARTSADAWVEDHASGRLIPLRDATLVRVAGTETPMGSGIVAFKGEPGARTFAAERGGTLVTLETLLTEARPGRDPERKG
jgi:copper chaperone NosL